MNFYKEYGVAQKLARSDLFEKITLGVICFSAQSSIAVPWFRSMQFGLPNWHVGTITGQGVNAIYIGVDADNNTAPTLIHSTWPYQLCDNLFCFFFSLLDRKYWGKKGIKEAYKALFWSFLYFSVRFLYLVMIDGSCMDPFKILLSNCIISKVRSHRHALLGDFEPTESSWVTGRPTVCQGLSLQCDLRPSRKNATACGMFGLSSILSWRQGSKIGPIFLRTYRSQCTMSV